MSETCKDETSAQEDPTESPRNGLYGLWAVFFRVGMWILPLLPAVLLAVEVRQYSVPAPFMDDWQFIPLLEKAAEGRLEMADLIQPHDEHRLFLPRLAILASYHLGRGDVRVQCGISVAIVALAGFCILLLARRCWGPGWKASGLALLANMAILSPVQWQNWLWPMQFAYFTPFVCMAVALVAVTGIRHPLARFLAGAACAAAGSLSFINGLLIWPALLPAVAVANYPSLRTRRLWIAAWCVAGVIAISLYFHGWTHNSADPIYAYGHAGEQPTMSTVALLKEKPLATLLAMGVFIIEINGSSLVRGIPVDTLYGARFFGVILLCCLAAGCVALWRNPAIRKSGAPWLCFGLHAFLTTTFISLGRTFRGANQPLTPRYTTYASFCVAAALLIVAVMLTRPKKTSTAADKWTGPLQITGTVLATVASVLLLINWSYGVALMRDWHDARAHSLAGVVLSKIHPGRTPAMNMLGVNTVTFDQSVAILERLGLQYPPIPDSPQLNSFGIFKKPLSQKTAGMEYFRARRSGSLWEAAGWAILPGAHRTADAVLLTYKNPQGREIITECCFPVDRFQHHKTTERKAFEFIYNFSLTAQEYARWEGEVDLSLFPSERPLAIHAWALDAMRRKVYQLPVVAILDGGTEGVIQAL